MDDGFGHDAYRMQLNRRTTASFLNADSRLPLREFVRLSMMSMQMFILRKLKSDFSEKTSSTQLSNGLFGAFFQPLHQSMNLGQGGLLDHLVYCELLDWRTVVQYREVSSVIFLVHQP
jgi:hypothetical protein